MRYSLFLILAAIVSVGCGSSTASTKSADGARAAMKQWVTDFANGDYKAACSMMTEAAKKSSSALGGCEKTLAFAAGIVGRKKLDQAPGKVDGVKVVVNGDKATVYSQTVYGKNGDEKSTLVFVSGRWMIDK